MSEPNAFHRFLHNLSRDASRVADKISKLFDKVIYSKRLSLIVSGVIALVFCISINFSDLSFRLFRSNAVTLNLAAVPVEVLIDENAYEVSGMPNTADVMVEGDPSDIQLVRTQNAVSVSADLRNMDEGTNTVSLDASGLPTGLDVKVSPATVQVTLSKKYSKTFFIEPDLIVGAGQIEANYEKPTLSTRSVTVRATRDKINSIRTIRAIIDTSSYPASFSADVPLVAYDAAGKQVNVTISPETVHVTVNVKNSAAADQNKDAATHQTNTDDTKK